MHNSFFPAPAPSLSQLLFLSLSCFPLTPFADLMCSQQAEHVATEAEAWLKPHTAANCTMYEEKVTNWHMLRLQNRSFTLSEKTLHFDSLYCNQGDRNSPGITLSTDFLRQVCVCCYTSVIVRTILIWKLGNLRVRTLRVKIWFYIKNRIRFRFESALIS